MAASCTLYYNFREKGQENGPLAKKLTRPNSNRPKVEKQEETGKDNEMPALRFQINNNNNKLINTVSRHRKLDYNATFIPITDKVPSCDTCNYCVCYQP